mgnify:CR=1 FL=1
MGVEPSVDNGAHTVDDKPEAESHIRGQKRPSRSVQELTIASTVPASQQHIAVQKRSTTSSITIVQHPQRGQHRPRTAVQKDGLATRAPEVDRGRAAASTTAAVQARGPGETIDRDPGSVRSARLPADGVTASDGRRRDRGSVGRLAARRVRFPGER